MSSADFDPDIKIGSVLTNKELAQTFKCGPMGGMRRSRKTNSLVLTTSKTAVYHDRWEGDVLHYTGMGLRGDHVYRGPRTESGRQERPRRSLGFASRPRCAGRRAGVAESGWTGRDRGRR
jgi:hypothetical protein